MTAPDLGVLGARRQAAAIAAPAMVGGAERGDQKHRSDVSAPVVLAMGAAAAAAAIGISKRKLEQLADAGEIRRVRLDGRVVYRVADLEDLLRRHLVGETDA